MELQQTNFYYYFDMISRRRRLVIIPVLLCTFAGVLLAMTLPPYYRSTTTILVEKQQIPEAYVQSTDKTPFNQRLNTLRQQIMSRQKLERIINDFHLYQDGVSRNPLIVILNRLGLKIKTKPLSKEGILNRMADDVEAKVIGGSSGDAFSISYVGNDPNITMQVTNMLASLFIEENLKSREQYAAGTSDFLANELENAKRELEAQERAVRAYKEKYMGALPQELETNLRTLDRLQMELQSINIEEKNAEDRNLMLEAQLNQPAGTPVSVSPVIPPNPLAAELQKLQHDLAYLLSTYKENYPDVVIAKKRINELKQLLARSGKNNEQNANDKKNDEFEEVRPEVRNPELYNNMVAVKTHLANLKQREAEVRKQIKGFEKRVAETPANEQKFVDLSRDYNISLKNYQVLLEKKLNAKLSENLEKRQKGERFTIIDPANLPDMPFKPNRTVIALMGIIAGLGTGIGLVLFFEFINPVFRKPEDFEGVVDLTVLALIPMFSSVSRKKYGRNLGLVKEKKSGGL